ncbi:hypothetical protein EMN47_18425 [Prolixibacteraceae bacterium JC049]|nr:hypothetical protein [Prolixibacteraceae bacterium JC049]
MVIENKKRSLKLGKIISLILFTYVIAQLVLFYFDLKTALIVVAVSCVIDIVILYITNPQYIYFTIENDKLIFRYYSVISIIGREYKSIEFPTQRFHRFSFKKNKGLRPLLSLSVKTRKGIATYPAVSLIALNKEEQQAILNQLQQLALQNEKRRSEI